MAEDDQHDPFTQAPERPDFTPMKMADEPPKEEAEIFGSDASGIKKAAEELSSHRAMETPPLERKYTDAQTGEERPMHETVTLKQAAHSLSVVHETEAAERERQANAQLAYDVDLERMQASLEAQHANPQAVPQEPQQQPQPEAPSIEPQPEAVQSHDGIDPEIAQALQNPKVRAALEQQVQAAEQQRVAYASAVAQAGNVAVQALVSNYPELRGVQNEQQLIGSLQAVAQSNPGRAQQIVADLQRVEGLRVAHAQNVAQQEQRQQHAAQQQFQTWAQSQDDAFDAATAKESPELMKRVRSELPTIMKDRFGLEPDTLRQLYNTQPWFRSAQAQQILLAAAKHFYAEQAAARPAPKPVPLVMRPGHGADYADDHDTTGIRSASREFSSELSPRAGAKLLQARRAAAARNAR